MNITDKWVLKEMKRMPYDLQESMEQYPDNERAGRSDVEFFADEVSYWVSCYNEDGHVWKDDLEDAKEKIRETKDGKVIPVDKRTFKPMHGYWPSDIETARSIIREYRTLRNELAKLQRMGHYGYWYTV